MSAHQILFRVSQSLAYRANLQECLQEIADTAGKLGGLDEVRASFYFDDHQGEQLGAFTAATQAQDAGVVLQRDLIVKGVEIGRLELQASKPKLRAVDLFKLFEAMVGLLQSYAELSLRNIEKRRLLALRTLLEQRLAGNKIEGRALGILESLYGLDESAAREWLANKSIRESVSLRTAAERVVERNANAARRKAA